MPHSDAYGNCDSNCHSHSYSNGDCNRNAYGHTYRYRQTYTNPKDRSYAKSSANARA